MNTNTVAFATGLYEVQCLLYYDGPLLSHFRDVGGKDWMITWTDLDDEYNYWYAIEVTPENMTKYYANEISLRGLMEVAPALYECKGTFINVEVEEGPEIGRGILVTWGEVPEGRRPHVDSFHDYKKTTTVPISIQPAPSEDTEGGSHD